MLATCLLLTVPDIQAQSNIRVDERFESNISGWKVGKSDDLLAKVDSGVYRIVVKNKGERFFSTRKYFLEKEEDYHISTEFFIDTSATSGYFGLIWGAKSGKDMYCLLVRDTIWAIRVYTGGKSKTLTKGAIKGGEDGNYAYSIEREAESYRILLNNEEIYAKEELPLQGGHFGYLAFDPVDVRVNKLMIKTSSEIPVLTNLPIGLKKRNLGKAINSSEPEKLPVISPDGNYLFFTVKEDSLMDKVYYSKRESREKWSPRKRMPWPVNVENSSSGVFSVSSDNNTLFMNGKFEDSVYVGKGISYLVRGEKGWETPKNIEIKDYNNQGKFVEHNLSADGKTLLHSLVDEKSIEGSYDLYVSFRINDSTWTKPVNLGKEINTGGDEISPFLAPDTKTLYFSTDGRQGFGSADIFMARRLDDSWTNWSTPMNLGPDVNTNEWDGYFGVDARGVYAYFTSKSNSMGSTDIFQMVVPPIARPQPVVIMRGKVKNASTGKALAATVICRDLLTDEIIGMARSAPRNGAYKIVLPKGRHYSFEASKDGYFSIRGNLDVSILDDFKEQRRDLALVPLKEGQNILLNNVFFDPGKATLREESEPELERVCELLKAHPEMEIEVAGHTYDMRESQTNLELSQKRADEVRRFILRCGLGGERVIAKGYGESRPLDDDGINGNCHKDKRVELVISTF
ncbi:MAG: OmpA family protein [Bacteroidota bacterium]